MINTPVPTPAKLKVLVGCEFSGRVVCAFRALGIEAYSCDLRHSEDFTVCQNNWHIQGDLLHVASNTTHWDLLVAFPPCTYLARSGSRWWASRQQEQEEAIEFVKNIYNLPIEHICIENPIGALSPKWKKPNQIIQPWQYGHPYTKSTCLWLKNLPLLKPTKVLPPIYVDKNHNLRDGRLSTIKNHPDPSIRSLNRSRTYKGIARAMAKQYTHYLLTQPLNLQLEQPIALNTPPSQFSHVHPTLVADA